MSNTDKSPCPPTADIVAKKMGNKEVSRQSIRVSHGSLAEDVVAVGRDGKEVALSPAGRRLGPGSRADCSPVGGPSGFNDASDCP